MGKYGTFHQSISKLLTERLSEYKDRSLKKDTCISIYVSIFETLQGVFESSGAKITNESLNWIAQSYYDAIDINGSESLDPNIFDKRASLDNIETKELALLATMLKDSPFAIPVIAKIKGRT